MDKPIIHNITTNFRSVAQALNDGVAYENIDDRNLTFYSEEVTFSSDVVQAADYIEYSLNVVSGYTDTKIYFDEMLNDGNYLNDLADYETNIINFYNDAYNTSATELTDGMLNDLSAREMEALTSPLINAVVYPEHHTQVVTYYAEFRGVKTNAEVYHEIVDYLQPLTQGMSRLLATAAGDVFTEGSDAYNDLQVFLDDWATTRKAEITSYLDDAGVTTAQLGDLADQSSNIAILATEVDKGDASTIKITADNINNINNTGDSIANVNIVATNITDINTIVANIADVQTANENAQLAKNYAIKTDGEVETGTYSAKYHAETASTYATTATTNSNASYVSKRQAEALQLTCDSYATESEDVPVKLYTYDETNDQITSVDTNPIEYSALHYKIKAVASSLASESAKTAAETAKADAETAKADAETARIAAEAIYDSYDDRYLGSFDNANIPTTDNDGATLLVGATYWNSDDKVIKWWNGAAWEDPVAVASVSADNAATSETNAATSELKAADWA